jgi:5-methyltetrahydrofolate corrinoid/iron sulfur protein methyltransferase
VSRAAPVIIVGEQINQTYMVMAMARGLDAAIVDPTDPRMMVNILTARMLLGQDTGCKGYLTAYRQGRLGLDGGPS